MRWNKAMLVYNRKAGKEKAGQLGAAVEALAAEAGELTLVQTEQPGDGEKVCRERGGECDLLLLLGGDGTVHECVNGAAAAERRPDIAVLPGGTCNDFARTLRLPLQIGRAAETVLAQRLLETDIGKVNGRFFTNFVGIGLITDTSENIDSDQKDKMGKLSYFLSTLRTLRQAEPFRFRLTHDEGTVESEAVMILAANGRSLGTARLPFAENALQDGMLDVLIVREAGLTLAWQVINGGDLTDYRACGGVIEYIQTSNLRIETDEPKRIDTDGEIYLETPADISVLPGHLRFYYGEEAGANLNELLRGSDSLGTSGG
ncbi:YegS/Rv2252/BmrU family lipid kinase [Saccharibacillus sp. CPCC 101409]|uniref:diacylglycerol/lipid kinase family protein n=1 Tax=Saccharibacillus sp. CPCC 101409 TaxID=3058041 RepID=UPI002672315A|nr:YegS/Rv2252/BmrU family lipid kinase [Saccharibacillus sp. CPCC 101409]MDO3410114.1 YegS/Rv2252/BmrU family lipid kinase [Saccharibacillus sp. CPCC 101409]